MTGLSAETLDLPVRYFARVESVIQAILAHPAVPDKTVVFGAHVNLLVNERIQR